MMRRAAEMDITFIDWKDLETERLVKRLTSEAGLISR